MAQSQAGSGVHDDLAAWAAQVLGTPVTLQRLAGEASFKEFFRVGGASRAVIAMHVPKPDSVEIYARFRELFASASMRVPEIIAIDTSSSFALIEDFGDDQFDRVVKRQPDKADSIYKPAWEAVNIIHAKPLDGLDLPRYGVGLFDRELDLFDQWYASSYRGRPLADEEKQQFERIRGLLGACFAEQHQVLTHRDFHSRNLFVLDDGELGVIDFSDAVIGPITYDICCLLRDLYVDIDPEAELDYLVRHWEHARAMGLPVPDDFVRMHELFEFTSLQRLVKILGLFVRIATRDGKQAYLEHLPRCEMQAHAIALRYRDLRPLAIMIEERAG